MIPTPLTKTERRRRATTVLGVIAAATLILSGCTRTPVQPIPYEQANTEAWFSGSTGYDLTDSFKNEYDDSRQVYNEQQYAEAVRRYQALAEDGVPEAAYELGKAYRFGKGVPRDSQLAAQWFMAAVSESHSHWPHASYHLGTMFLEGEGVPRDVVIARRLLEQALENEIEQAALPLAKIYAQGLGVERDVTRAERLAQRSAETGNGDAYLWLLRGYGPDGVLGEDPARTAALSRTVLAILMQRVRQERDPEAMRDLAMLYYEGLGVTRDPMTAVGWLDRAAQVGRPAYLVDFGEDVLKGTDGFTADPALGFEVLKGAAERYRDPEAMALVAEAYRDGQGTKADMAAAESWLKRAVEAGSIRAALDYGRILATRRDDPQAMQLGVANLERAARAGLPYAWAELGELHTERAFDGADPVKGVDYLQRAHKAGIPSATYHLGKVLLGDYGIKPDPARAETLLQQAADQGQDGALVVLGQAYLEGKGLPRRPQLAKKWLEKAVAQGQESARLTLGRAYLSGQIPGNPLRGKQIVTDYAKQGNGFAMMELGRTYRDGGAVPPNHFEAKLWFQKALAAGEPGAEQALASLLFLEGNRDPIQIVKLQRAAELGHDGAMSALGRAYLEGQGVAPSTLEGMVWLSRAVDAGNMSAAQTLGSAYLRGDYGLDHDPDEGLRLLERSAAAGNRSAERDLGYALVNPQGTGLRPNLERGMRLLTQAARRGDVYAMELLGTSYLDGSQGVAPDPENARVWLSMAARKGDISSMTALGSAYVDGRLPEKNHLEKGLNYLEKAAAGGDDTARTKLGNLYIFGAEGLAPQPEKGREIIAAAVENGHAGAKATLGRAYVEGALGPKRIEEGARLLFDAARAGHKTARLILAEAFLRSQGLETANRDYAEAWLDSVTAGDSAVALQTLTEALRSGKEQPSDAAAKAAR